jgi:hypothetical protein
MMNRSCNKDTHRWKDSPLILKIWDDLGRFEKNESRESIVNGIIVVVGHHESSNLNILICLLIYVKDSRWEWRRGKTSQ